MEQNYSLYFSFFMATLLWGLVGIEKEIPKSDTKLAYWKWFWGVRSYAMVSLLWAVSVWIWDVMGIDLFVVFCLFFVSCFVLIFYAYWVFREKDLSAASEYWVLLTYFIGVFVMLEYLKLAIIFSILLTILLSSKSYFEGLKDKVSRDELVNTLKFAVIAFVVLPLLPDEKFSIAQILSFWGDVSEFMLGFKFLSMKFVNPHSIWFFVVIMSAVSFSGYVATKIMWKKGGIMISSVLWGLISSTAVTASMTEKSKSDKTNIPFYTLWTIIASSIMFLRVIFIILLFDISLLWDIYIPSLVMFWVFVWMGVYFYVNSKRHWLESGKVKVETDAESPFTIAPALKFALFILFIKFLSSLGMTYKEVWWEQIFYYVLWVISWLADVDAITQTMAVDARDWLIMSKVAVYTILIAVMSNNLVKWSIAVKFWEKSFGRKVMFSFILSMIAWIIAMIIS